MVFFDLIFWAVTLDVLGKIILGVSVIGVHWKIVKEHSIDGAVLKEIRHERNLAIFGILLIIVAYILELIVIYELF